MSKNFYESVYDIVTRIPKGKVMTYGQIAEWLGNPRASRAVGWAMRATPEDRDIPWHRVIRKDGSFAPYMTIDGNIEPDIRRELLEEEGIAFLLDGRVDMQKHQL